MDESKERKKAKEDKARDKKDKKADTASDLKARTNTGKIVNLMSEDVNVVRYE